MNKRRRHAAQTLRPGVRAPGSQPGSPTWDKSQNLTACYPKGGTAILSIQEKAVTARGTLPSAAAANYLRAMWLMAPPSSPSGFSLLLSPSHPIALSLSPPLSLCTHSYACSWPSQWKYGLGKKERLDLLRTFCFDMTTNNFELSMSGRAGLRCESSAAGVTLPASNPGSHTWPSESHRATRRLSSRFWKCQL